MNEDHLARAHRVMAKTAALLPQRKGKPVDSSQALSVLMDKEAWRFWDEEFPSELGFGRSIHVDLEGVDLAGLWFMGHLGGLPCLNHATFRDAKLDGSLWVGWHLVGTDFTRASLSGCLMTGVLCSGANFRETDLSGASLKILGTEEEPVDLTGANLLSFA